MKATLFPVAILFNIAPKKIKRLQEQLDSADFTPNEDQKQLTKKKENQFVHVYKTRKAENLLYILFIEIQIQNSKPTAILYLDTAAYARVKKYKRKTLLDEGTKIKTEAKFRKIDGSHFYCVELLRVEKTKGS